MLGLASASVESSFLLRSTEASTDELPKGNAPLGAPFFGRQCLLASATSESSRALTKELTTMLDVHRDFSSEQALSRLRDDELLEVTAGALRFRK